MLTSNLLERAFIELETEEWAKADELLEQVLNVEPRNAQAYIGKLMAELQVAEEEKLAEQTAPIDGYANFKKALRFADDEKKAVYNGYNDAIKNRLSSAQQDASSLTERAFIELEFEDWDKAIELFDKAVVLEPQNAKIYIGKLMAELRVAKEEDLANVTQALTGYDSYKMALEYAEEDMKKVYAAFAEKSEEETNKQIFNIVERCFNNDEAKMFARSYERTDEYSEFHYGELNHFEELQHLLTPKDTPSPKKKILSAAQRAFIETYQREFGNLSLGEIFKRDAFGERGKDLISATEAVYNATPKEDTLVAILFGKTAGSHCDVSINNAVFGAVGICRKGLVSATFPEYSDDVIMYIPYRVICGYQKNGSLIVSKGSNRSKIEWDIATRYTVPRVNGIYLSQMVEEIRTTVLGLPVATFKK